MKTSLYSSVSLLILLVVTTKSQDQSGEQFCQKSGAKVSRAFITTKHIYFGDGLSFWKMSTLNFEISPLEKVGTIFGESECSIYSLVMSHYLF